MVSDAVARFESEIELALAALGVPLIGAGPVHGGKPRAIGAKLEADGSLLEQSLDVVAEAFLNTLVALGGPEHNVLTKPRVTVDNGFVSFTCYSVNMA
jgi:hypothetical protein